MKLAPRVLTTRLPLICLALLFLVARQTEAGGPAAGGASQPVLDEVPAGYSLHAYDDCGIEDRQPHVLMQDSYCWTFNTSDTDADLKSRSAVFSYKAINIQYNDLDPKLSYVLALTYASDHVYKRVQSLWADGVELHGPLALPKAQAIRRVVLVPHEVTSGGKMQLQIRIHGEVNATVSIVELWANQPPRQKTLRLFSVSGMVGDLTGQVLDIAYEPVQGAAIELHGAGIEQPLATTRAKADGWFRLARKSFETHSTEPLTVRATSDGGVASAIVPADQLSFQPVRYVPRPSQVGGLPAHEQVLDGTWLIDPDGTDEARSRPLAAPSWKQLQVPGQWRQQGFDIPAQQAVAMARRFVVPAEWSGYRIYLRFDAIHAGVEYWLNGNHLGRSDNLFTPVQWDITPYVHPGESNRLDLKLKVDTESERLSYSSAYAFHNLGGIDRSVRIFAVPQVHLEHLRIDPQLDGQYRDARLTTVLRLNNPDAAAVDHVQIVVSVKGPDGRDTLCASESLAIDLLPTGMETYEVSADVAAPLKWNAEQPHLYQVVVELKRGAALLERIERNVGFRSIEIKGRMLCVNGVPVKLAGACHHETDPLTGRADTMRHGEKDIRLLKAANLNYVRTSHYPPTMELVEAADRYGMYLEVEAPFCWVAPQDNLLPLRDVLEPTSAMIDYYQTHPSVIIWSLANESHFNRFFEISNTLVKQLDPTRPTTFNNPDPRRICDIVNLHYPPMPYDELAKDDPAPVAAGRVLFSGMP